ncbi:DEAD/DEAH box helicase, partial [Klebsiella pneumoniae]|nr:DEAD/DEAH box helicase [Klebsiella pneumoniae]
RTIDLSDQKLDNIQHFYMQVDQRHRVDMLRKLAHVEDSRGLVFFNRLSALGNHEEKLHYRDLLAVSLASDVNVKFRKIILEKFKDNQLTLLLATDLLARGIDIDSLECVVNFD